MAKKIIIIAVSVALVGYLLSQLDLHELVRVAAGFPPGYVLGGFLLFIAGHYVRSIRFRILLGGGLPVGGLFRVVALQTAAIGFVPFRAGEFSLMYLLKSEYAVEYSRGAAVLVLTKTFDFLVVVSLFLVSSGMLDVVPPFYREFVPWAGGAFFVLTVTILLMARSREIFSYLPSFFREGPLAEGAFISAVRRVLEGVEVIRSKKTLALSLLVSVVLWVLLYSSNFLLIRGAGLELDLMEMVFLTTSMSLFVNLPIHSPAGFGTTEAFWTGVLLAMGIPKETGIATGFACHIITIIYSLVFMLYGMGMIWRRGGKAG